jgi:hypothetical protein
MGLRDWWIDERRRWEHDQRQRRLLDQAYREDRRGWPVFRRFPMSRWSRWLLALGWTSLVAFVLLVATKFVVSIFKTGGWVKAAVEMIDVLFTPVITLGLGYLIFWWLRHWITADYFRRARTTPEVLVPTAGSILGAIIGRDELCRMLIDNLRDPDTARPNVIVGGVGAGKTAVLVRLTKMLADRGALPVAIRLRDAVGDLDFEREAFERFKAEVNRRLFSEADADRAWRHLRRDNRVVVLADGLEETLNRPDQHENRTSGIQLAIRKAAETRLPLVIASRHHDPLRVMETTITELEPLGEGPILDFLAPPGTPDRDQMAYLVQGADVVESPLYLQVIHDLRQRDRLRRLMPDEDLLVHLTAADRQGRGVACPDRTTLRLAILSYWEKALIGGQLFEDYGLSRTQRKKTITVLAALACVGLSKDTLEVDFDDLLSGVDERAPHDGRERSPAQAIATRLIRLLGSPLGDPKGSTDGVRDWLRDECAQAAIKGGELGLVESREGSVRFQHSILQAYLGSDYLPAALKDQVFLDAALTKCGRDFLTALVMHSRRPRAEPTPPAETAGNTTTTHEEVETRDVYDTQIRAGGAVRFALRHTTNVSRSVGDGRPVDLVQELRRAARRQWRPTKKFDTYAAALEIDCGASGPNHSQLVQDIADDWNRQSLPSGQQDPAVIEAKIMLVKRIGQTARKLASDTHSSAGSRLNYKALFDIATGETEHAVKLALVQEIGEGGASAVPDMKIRFTDWWGRWERWWRTSGEPTHRRAAKNNTPEDRGRLWREGVICAWLAPLLVSTVDNDTDATSPLDLAAGGGAAAPPAIDDDPGTQNSRYVLDNLQVWITEYLGRIDPRHPEKRPWISLEVALAQGFKLAANRRQPTRSEQYEKQRVALIEQAELALKHSRFWFAQLSLIQALALLCLPADPNTPLRYRGHGSDPVGLVAYWLAIAGTGFAEVEHQQGHRGHPFVLEAAWLAVQALTTRHPERYLWIDEEGSVREVGSPSLRTSTPREHQQWILPSVGWSVLHPRAQELLGDVLVMLNLAERSNTQDPAELEQRLTRSDRPDLPPCMVHDRTSMDVGQTVGSAAIADPGSSCHDDCLFRLCPYPPLGGPSYRAELPEGFCRKLAQTNERSRYEGQLSRAAHRDFWMEMTRRVRPRILYGGRPASPRVRSVSSR